MQTTEPKKTLVFDWDGTLHNTLLLYGKAFRKAYAWLVEEGLAPQRIYTDEEVSIYLGMPAPLMWKTFMPDLAEEKRKIAAGMIGAEMDRLVAEGQAILYEGMEETLAYLKAKGYHLVILSNCRHNYMEEHKRVFQLDRFFDAYFAAEDYGFMPKEDIFSIVMEQFPGPYAMIGDRAADMKVGTQHGVFTVGCDYGFGEPEERAAASVHIERLPELKTLF